MNIYGVVRIDKHLEPDIMFLGSEDECKNYLQELNNDKKYNKYNEFVHYIKPVFRYKLTFKKL